MNASDSRLPLLQLRIGHADDIQALSFSPDGKTLVSGGDDGALKSWDVCTGKLLHTVDPFGGEWIHHVRWIPDGHVAVCSWSDEIAIVDVHAGVLLRGMALREMHGPRLSPDGNHVLVTDRHRLRLIELATWTELWRAGTAAIRPIEVAFSPDGKTLSVSDLANVWLVCARTGRVLRRLWRCGNEITAMEYSPDGRMLAQTTEGKERDSVEIIFRLTSDGRRLASLPVPTDPDDSLSADDLTRLAFSPDGGTLAAGTTKGTVLLWDIAAGRLEATLGDETFDWIRTVAFHPDGKTLAAAGNARTITLWDVGTGRVARRFGLPLKEILCLDVSSDGKTLIAGDVEGAVTIWDLTNCHLKVHRKAGSDRVTSVRTHPGARAAWSFGFDGAITRWDLQTGRESWKVNWRDIAFCAAAFSPDGGLVAVGGWWRGRSASDTCHVWLFDPSTGQVVRDLDVGRSIEDVAFSPDGGTLAVISSGNISLWDTSSGSSSWSSPLHVNAGDWVDVVAFSPDSRILAQGMIGGHVVLRDVPTRREIASLPVPHDSVSGLVFSPDGRRIAVSTAYDRTITLWDVRSGELLRS